MSDFYWKPEVNGAVSGDAVPAGRDINGSVIYAGRAYHEGDLLPAKVIPDKGGAFIAWNGGEHSVFSYEVLCGGPGAWKPASHGAIPDDALHVGNNKEGERLFLGRVWHEGSLVPGKIHPSHGVCYIPFGGQEIPFKEYEVLIQH